MKIVVDNEAHGHNILVINLADHRDKLRLELSESTEQVAQSLTFLARLRLIDDLVSEVDISFDEIHVFNQFFELFGHSLRTATARLLSGS